MPLYTLNIKETEFRVAVIKDDKQMKEGLSNKPKLAKGKGLLFNFISEQEVTMNMKDMNYPLDMVFINNLGEVAAVRTLLPGNFQTTVKDIRYVLEINSGEGAGFVGEIVTFSKELSDILDAKEEEKDVIEKEEPKESKHLDMSEESEEQTNHHQQTGGLNIVVKITSSPEQMKKIFKAGGRFNMDEVHVKADNKAMQVLDDTGKILMNIVGGERIFSIEHTEEIIAMAKRIDRGDAKEEDLGKLMKKIINIQDTQEPQYV
jgi:uncharacterized membrane protein (UPF0127 family)